MGRTWGKLYAGTRNHPKIAALRREFPRVWKVFYVMLDMAIEADNQGYLFPQGSPPLTVKGLAKELDENAKKIEKICDFLDKIGVISMNDFGPKLLSFSERQFCDSYERTRAYRQRIKEKDGHGDVTVTRHGDALVTEKKKLEAESTKLNIYKEGLVDSNSISPPISPPLGGDDVSSPPKLKKKRAQPETPYSEDFLAFWKAYPNRKGGQEAAWRNWEVKRKAKKLPPLEYLLKCIALLKKSETWLKDDGAYIPMITTFLNKGRWTDADNVRAERSRDGPDPDCPDCNGTGIYPGTLKKCKCWSK